MSIVFPPPLVFLTKGQHMGGRHEVVSRWVTLFLMGSTVAVSLIEIFAIEQGLSA